MANPGSNRGSNPGSDPPPAPWRCPVCQAPLRLAADRRQWACPVGHSFDVAREGYVNLLLASRRRSHQPGDSAEMVTARRRFLATGAFDPLTDAVARAVAAERPTVVLDIGCGEGRHTRKVPAPVVLGVDVAKAAVAAAARAHPDGWYVVSSAADLPVADGGVDVALSVFAPVLAAELARVVRPGGAVVVAYPGPEHLEGLRRLVYAQARPHEVKLPLQEASEHWTETATISVRFPVVVTDTAALDDLFAMTPYRWHAPPDIHARLAGALAPSFETVADIRVTTLRRRTEP